MLSRKSHSHVRLSAVARRTPARALEPVRHFQDEGGETVQERRPKRKPRTLEYYKQRFRKNLAQLLEEETAMMAEENGEAEEEEGPLPGYLAAQVPDSAYPGRRLCAVCGFPSQYTCVTCGTRYCSLACLETHQDTRCLKWTV